MMDEQGSKKKIPAAIIVLILVATATSLLAMMTSKADIDSSLADAAPAAANEKNSKIDKASLQPSDEFPNSQQNEQGHCEYLCFNVQDRTK
jgi:hypothetical protein